MNKSEKHQLLRKTPQQQTNTSGCLIPFLQYHFVEYQLECRKAHLQQVYLILQLHLQTHQDHLYHLDRYLAMFFLDVFCYEIVIKFNPFTLFYTTSLSLEID